MEQTHEIIDDLRMLPCLANLKDDELSLIREKAQVREYFRKDIIIKESDSTDFFFIVRKGGIKLFKTSSDGREIVIKKIGPNDYFCCAPIFLGKKYFVNAVALESSSLVMIPAEDFKGLLSNSMGEMGFRVISGLCKRIKDLSHLVSDITFMGVEERIVRLLYRLTEEKPENSDMVPLTSTHQDIASMTGTVREVVSRVILKLKKEGIVESSGTKKIIINRKELARCISAYHFDLNLA